MGGAREVSQIDEETAYSKNRLVIWLRGVPKHPEVSGFVYEASVDLYGPQCGYGHHLHGGHRVCRPSQGRHETYEGILLFVKRPVLRFLRLGELKRGGVERRDCTDPG